MLVFGFVQGKEVRRLCGVDYVACRAYRGRSFYLEARADMGKPELVDYCAKTDTYFLRDLSPPVVKEKKTKKKRFFLF